MGGAYRVTRLGSFSAPVSVIVDMLCEGLLQSEHELTDNEVRKLMLAIVAALSNRSEEK